MISVTKLLKIAQKHLGQGGAIFRKFCGLPAGAAWCNAFVDYIGHEGGVASLFFNGKKETYCPHSIKWCEENLGQIPLYLAMAMDIIYFDWERNHVPNHIGFVRGRKSTDAIYTIEGNTDGGRVAQKTRTAKYIQGIYRPHFVPQEKLTKHKLKKDGAFEYQSIYNLQLALGGVTADGILGKKTIKRIQQYLAIYKDGAWGSKTSLSLQKMLKREGFYKGELDSEFGQASVKALQAWINAKNYPKDKVPASKPTASKPTASKPTAKPKSYIIKIDLTNQICTVYGVDAYGKSTPVMSEWVSTARKGKTTPVGHWKIQGASGGRNAKYRTAKMSSGKAYAEFLVRFKGSKCMHTVPYKKRQTTGHVNKAEFNKLGTQRSAGCVRMPWKMAHYIYENCPLGTPVIVYKGKMGDYPMGKPKYYTATTDIDPTYKK